MDEREADVRAGGQPLDWRRVAGLTMAGVALVLALAVQPMMVRTQHWAQDFDAYRAAALRLANGGSLYTSLSLSGDFEPMGQELYLYPPPLGIALTPIAQLSAQDGAVAWYLLHIIVLAACCALMPIGVRVRIVAFAVGIVSFGVYRDLMMGNVSVLLMLPLVAGWRWLDRPVGSLALALATSVRVTFGIYLLWFVFRRAWRPLLWMVAGGGALLLLSLPSVGIDGYLDYFTMLGNISGTEDLFQNRHLTHTALQLGVPLEIAWWVLVPVWCLALVSVFLSRRRDPEVGFMVTASAGLLLAPLIWDHYLSLVLLPSAFLAERGRKWALALPLLTWLPHELLPLVPIAALLMPFLARDKVVAADDPDQVESDPHTADPQVRPRAASPSSP